MSCPYAGGQSAARRAATLAAQLATPPAGWSHPSLSLSPTTAAGSAPASYKDELLACRKELWSLLDSISCNPILVRLAWHDSGTFDRTVASWPECGGANGSIRFADELGHGANAGLAKGINVYLAPIKQRHPSVSWADLIQLGSATAVAHAGGPAVPMRYGRVDVPTAGQCPPAGRLPEAAAPFADGSPDAACHLRAVFHRMGFDDREIVALSGAHTLGRAWKERSGASPHGAGDGGATAYTRGDARARGPTAPPGVGLPGGQSWTRHWLLFDNSYFSALLAPAGARDPLLLRLETDDALASDPGFAPHARRYAADQATFFADYAAAHAKLAELGSAFAPAGGVAID